jgi:tetratricopeptide (TPR) repeat protein
MFTELDIPRRVAQIELSLAVVQEMSGQLESSARHYELLTGDQRLSPRDRARARLWVGTTLSKAGDNAYAIGVMVEATHLFEDLGEPEDWSVAHQKLALAHRGAGDLRQALHHIDIARTTGTVDSPMQRVRLDTAYGHILLSDAATRDDGLSVLDQAAQVARQYGLSHQLRSIEGIRKGQPG